MKIKRGDVVLADYPHSSGTGSKLRPVLVVQDDYYNKRIANVVVANITSNLKNAKDRAHYLIEAASPEGKRSGLRNDSVISCINLATIREDRIRNMIGDLSDRAMQEINECLKAALGLP